MINALLLFAPLLIGAPQDSDLGVYDKYVNWHYRSQIVFNACDDEATLYNEPYSYYADADWYGRAYWVKDTDQLDFYLDHIDFETQDETTQLRTLDLGFQLFPDFTTFTLTQSVDRSVGHDYFKLTARWRDINTTTWRTLDTGYYPDEEADGETYYLRPQWQYSFVPSDINKAKESAVAYMKGYDLSRLTSEYQRGWNDGYEVGVDYGTAHGESGRQLNNVFDILGRAFYSVGNFFNMKVFGTIPLYTFFLAPLFITLITLLLRMVKH